MATKEKIEDFGEEIFGARKHLAQLNRELRVSDLEGWTDAERQENINKDTAFPKVNYKKEYENGKDRTVLFYIKKLRDSLPKEPAYPPKRLRTPEQHEMDKRQAQESYLTTISYVYQKAMKLEKPSDCTFFMNEVMREHLPDKEKILQKTNFNLNLDNRYNQFSFSKELQKKQFLYSDKEKILSKYTIGQYDGKNIQNEERLGNANYAYKPTQSTTYYFHIKNDEAKNLDNWKENTYFAYAYNRELVAFNEPSKEALENKIYEAEKGKTVESSTRKAGKESLKPPQLAHIRPTLEDYRGGRQVVKEDFMKDSPTATFPFRGVQFGNWTNQNDRQESMNMTFDAFKDLAKALNIKDEDITLGKDLAIAYGARGHSGAVAHYEPVENVINLTKMNGAGSLGHEWGHALDSYIATKIGSTENFATEGVWLDGRKGIDNPISYRIMFHTHLQVL